MSNNHQAGKGKRPIKGYNPKNWYKNYDSIKWCHSKKKENNGKQTNSNTTNGRS